QISPPSLHDALPIYLGGAAYNASKQALCALVHQINIEEGMHGIRGCAIHPGETVTPLQKARPKPPSPEDQARMLKMEDVGRVVRDRKSTRLNSSHVS